MRFVLILLILTACSSNGFQARVPASELPGLGTKHSIRMTSDECENAGGAVVGDIGDGRIHNPGYLCENGEVPIGTIVPQQGQSVPVEGAVCCGG